MRKGFCIPSRRKRRLNEIDGKVPGSAAISGIADGAIVRPSRMLRRCMEFGVVYSRLEPWKNNLEGLNGTIQVLIIDGILIMPNPLRWVCHLVADEYNPIVSRVGFDLGHRRARPGVDGRLHSHRATNG